MHLRAHRPLLGLSNKLLSVSSTPSSLPFSLSTATSSWEPSHEKEEEEEPQFGLIPSDPETYAHLLVSFSKQIIISRSRNPFDDKSHRIFRALKNCKILHARAVKFGFQLAGKLGNGLVDVYSKSGNLVYARNAFNSLAEHDGMAWNSILSVHSRQGSPEEVIRAFGTMRNTGASPDQFAFAIVLSSCGRLGALSCGRQVHCDVIKRGFLCHSFCEGSLIDMYAKSKQLDDARRFFDGVRNPDTISWTALIAGYARISLCGEALELFARMQNRGCTPDQVTFVTAISACVYLGKLKDARDLFAKMPSPNDVAWNAIISGHSQNGHEGAALGFFRDMRGSGIKPTRSTLGTVLSASANLAAFDEGRQVHSEAIRLGLDSNVFVGSSLMNMYSKCCSVEDARKVFDKLDEKNLITWNAMLGGYAQNGQPDKLVDLFLEMKDLGFRSDEFTYVSLFGACAGLENLNFGRQLHSVVIKSNFEESLFVGNTLVDMYAKSGEIDDARQQFELMPSRDVVSWNAIIVGYGNNKFEEEVLSIFCRMRLDDVVVPDEVSFATIIGVCVNICGYDEGKQVHCLSIKFGLETNIYVGSSLIDFYAKSGEMEAADRVFAEMPERSVVSWNALIAGLIQNNKPEEALNLLRQMLIEGIKPSQVTYASIMPACIGPLGLYMGRQLHCHTLKSGILGSDVFLEVALIGMYSKSQCHEDANRLFFDVPNNNSTVLWTSIISGHAQNGYSEDAFQLFCKMHSNDTRSDQATFACALRACADLAALKDGKEVHSLIIRTGFESDEYTSGALIDMYSKCGEIGAAFQVFGELENKEDIISWNSMIVGFAKNGFAKKALMLFCQMLQVQRQPDDITFLGVLTACSHAGLVSEGRRIFDSLAREYGIKPRVDHYACMIDLLGRGGYLKEAEELIDGLPFEPDGVVWATLLSACRMHGDEIRGARAAKKLIKLEPDKSSSYVLLSNIYAALGNWEGFKMVRETMKERGVRKLPGCSWIEVGNRTSSFVSGDKFHPSAVDIYAALKALTAVIKEEGYAAELNLLLQDDD